MIEMHKETKIITIDHIDVSPGEQKTIALSVGALPSGTDINICVHVFRSMFKGPTVLGISYRYSLIKCVWIYQF